MSANKIMKMKYSRYLIMLVAACVVCTSCRHRTESFSHIDKSVVVETMTVQSLLSKSGVTFTGTVEAAEQTTLGFALGGKLLDLRVHAGDYVAEGQVLAHIDSLTAYNSLLSARATLRQAEDAYLRLEKVRNGGGVTEAQWQEMLTRLEQARSVEAIAANELRRCTLTAPFSGVIGSADVVVGQTLLPMQPVVTLLNTNSMNVVFAITENDLDKVQKGSRVDIELGSAGEHTEGRVTEKSLVRNNLTRTYNIKARFDKTQRTLVPGMSCKVHLYDERQEIVIPAHCLSIRREGPAVWVVADGKAHLIAVTTSGYAKNGVIIKSGLTTSDTIVVAGYQNLFEGAQVSIK